MRFRLREPYNVARQFAKSKDGTRVPYFIILPKGAVAGGKMPTLLYGYGGFEVSLDPDYSGTVGRAWPSTSISPNRRYQGSWLKIGKSR